MPHIKDESRWHEQEEGVWVRRVGDWGEQGVNATAGAIEAANDLDVDITLVTGSGKDGRITKGDVEAYAAS